MNEDLKYKLAIGFIVAVNVVIFSILALVVGVFAICFWGNCAGL